MILFTGITSQVQQVPRLLISYRKRGVLCKRFITINVFQVNAKLVSAAYSQTVDLVESEPKLGVQIAEASFVVIPSSEKIRRSVKSLLKHRPSSTSCFLITEDFKFSQTIRIDFVNATDLVT